MPDYSYRLTDIVTYDDETAYEIEFEQREDIDHALYKGIIYINTADFAILHAEFELNQSSDTQDERFIYLQIHPRGFNTWPVSVKYSVSYRKVNDIYFLNHVRGDLIFIFEAEEETVQYSVPGIL